MFNTSPYQGVPEVPSEIFLEKGNRSWFSVVVPEERTNLDTNPSFELGITGITNAGGATSAQSSTDQRRGVYSCAITMSSATEDGVYKEYSLSAATQYAISMDVKAPAGMELKILFTNSAGNVGYGRVQWTANGQWQRMSVNGVTVTATTYRVYLQKHQSTKTGVVYTDGWQIEVGAYPTTYIDGDLSGLVPDRQDFYWNGVAHASTSTRIGQCRIGGKIVNLSQFGFRTTAILGGGLSGMENKSTPMSSGGAYYHGTDITARQLSLVGMFSASDFTTLQRNKSSFYDVVRPKKVVPDQPLVLVYQRLDEQDAPIGEAIHIQAVLSDSLPGNMDNYNAEKVAIVFDVHTPFLGVEDGNLAATLSYNLSIANANYLIANVNGTWQTLGTAPDNIVYSCAIGLDGAIYISGSFLNVGGIAATRVAKYLNGSWSALGTGLSGLALQIKINPTNGYPYFFGQFTTANGVTVNYVTYWNGSTFVALGGTPGVAGGSATCGTFGPDGTLYVGGGFTSAGGVAANRVASWNGSAWSALGSGFSAGTPYGLEFGINGYLYALGTGTTPASVAYWNGTTWTSIGGTQGNLGLGVDRSGRILAGGQDYLYIWNGTSWTSVYIFSLRPAASILIVNGIKQLLPSSDLVVSFRDQGSGGTAWDEIVTPGNSFTNKYEYLYPYTSTNRGNYDNDYYNGTYVAVGDRIGTITAAALTTITNTDSRDSALKFKFTGPGSLYSIRNYTTGNTLYFSLVLAAGETAYLDLSAGNIRFYSNVRANLMQYILPGSALSSFRLIPGINKLSVLLAGTTSASTSVAIQWKKSYISLDNSIR